MAVPKKHTTRSSVGQRRMHIFLKNPTLTTCSKCGKPVKPHTVCMNCGFYKGKEVVNVLAKLEKKEKKQRQEEIKGQEKEQGKPDKPLTMEELSKKKF